MKPERRKHTDKVLKTATLITTIGCLAIIGCLCFLYLAQPEMQTGTAKYNDQYIRSSWLRQWLPYANIFAILGAFSMLVSLILRRKRNRRKLDTPIQIHIFLSIASMILMTFVLHIFLGLPPVH